jgi:histone-lysine N-methyltransferase SETMAR
VKAANFKVVLVLHFLHSKGIKTVPQPPYSPDIAPCNFFLYPQVKKLINGGRFEIVKAIEAILKKLSKNGFQHVFEQWQHPWDT